MLINVEVGVVLAIYVCAKCLFCFERAGNIESCPDCASMSVRLADSEEEAEYRRNRAELSGSMEREQKER